MQFRGSRAKQTGKTNVSLIAQKCPCKWRHLRREERIHAANANGARSAARCDMERSVRWKCQFRPRLERIQVSRDAVRLADITPHCFVCDTISALHCQQVARVRKQNGRNASPALHLWLSCRRARASALVGKANTRSEPAAGSCALQEVGRRRVFARRGCR